MFADHGNFDAHDGAILDRVDDLQLEIGAGLIRARPQARRAARNGTAVAEASTQAPKSPHRPRRCRWSTIRSRSQPTRSRPITLDSLTRNPQPEPKPSRVIFPGRLYACQRP
jgi:hypothetical protein